MKRRLIYLSSLTLTVVVNLTLASAHGKGGEEAPPPARPGVGVEERGDGSEIWEVSAKSEDGSRCGRRLCPKSPRGEGESLHADQLGSPAAPHLHPTSTPTAGKMSSGGGGVREAIWAPDGL